MTAIRRSFLAEQLGRGGGGFNVHEIDENTREVLLAAGLSLDEMERIAGKDGRIQGKTELVSVLDAAERAGDDGRPAPGGSTSAESRLAEALRREVERDRIRARFRGIVHFGMRPESAREVAALGRANSGRAGGVHAVHGAAVEGTATWGTRTFDLGRAAERDSLRAALVRDGMPDARAKELLDLVAEQDPHARDELAALGLALHRLGRGELGANRLVLSGHSTGSSLYGDKDNDLPIDALARLTRIFPEGAQAIEHLAVSACNLGYPEHVERYREMFPGVKSVWAYAGTSPRAEGGAPEHLRRWEEATDGDDPSQVDPGLPAVATWNVVDGYQGPVR